MINTDIPPNEAKFDVHFWADYVELLCLVNPDREISHADILDRVRERQDLNEANTQDFTNSSSPAENNDKWDALALNWFNHLTYRSAAFGAFYPFIVDNHRISAPPESTVQHHLYIFLLLASSLRFFDKKNQSLITSDFEELSKQALTQCFPETGEIHIFGSNPYQNSRYNSQNLWARINTLADNLGEQVTAKQKDFSSHNRGDGGLDIVGWVPTGDHNPGRLVIFGQCACTPDWTEKQPSADPNRWRQIMTLKSLPVTTTFIPLCPRDHNGSWHKEHDIHSFLIDRLRFVHYLQEKSDLITGLKSYTIVQEVISLREPVF